MNSDLEALEAAAEGLTAPGEPNAGIASPCSAEHFEPFRFSAAASATSRSPSFDPSDCPPLQSTGEADVFSWPSSEKERDWYSGVNLAGTEAERGTGEACSSAGQAAAGGHGREFVSSGLAFSPATGPVDVSAAVAFAHQSLPASSIKHCWEQGFWHRFLGLLEIPLKAWLAQVTSAPMHLFLRILQSRRRSLLSLLELLWVQFNLHPIFAR